MSDFAPVRSRNEDGGLFKLALRTSILTVLTAGIYRFWARTRIRRFIWSTISVEGDALEYTGTGLEKFLGFLVAVVVLAVYLGLVQLILLWFGLHYVFRPRNPAEMIMQAAVFYLSFFAVLPLMIFARFRARRYMLARTRFRSIRFGMEGSAWGYVGRTLWYGFLTIITLGIHLPRQTFNLERYKTDHSWFGDRQFEQKGHWQDLWRATHHNLYRDSDGHCRHPVPSEEIIDATWRLPAAGRNDLGADRLPVLSRPRLPHSDKQQGPWR